jgi:F-type H+-transporting ATPase subunit c
MRIALMTLLVASRALGQEAAATAGKLAPGGSDFFTIILVASMLGMTVTAVGVALAQAIAAKTALEGAARQPAVAPRLMTQMLVALVFMETLAIYALLVVFLLIFVNPFAKHFLL